MSLYADKDIEGLARLADDRHLPLAPWNDPDVEWRCEEHPDRDFEDCCGGAGVPYKNGRQL